MDNNERKKRSEMIRLKREKQVRFYKRLITGGVMAIVITCGVISCLYFMKKNNVTKAVSGEPSNRIASSEQMMNASDKETTVKVTKNNTSNDNTESTTKQEASTSEESTKKKKTADEIFKDAVFIGDSRTQGLYLYSGITQYCSNFMVHPGLDLTEFSSEAMFGNNNNKCVYDALKEKPYSKIFLMQGLNELAWSSSDNFIDKYIEAIKKIRSIQPKAEIYVQEIIQVSKSKSDSNEAFTKAHCDEWNKKIIKMCKKLDVPFIPINQGLTDKDGYLIEKSTTDGIHMTKEYYKIWLKELVEFFNKL